MINFCEHDYIEQLEHHIMNHAPYQQVLIIYDFTTPAMIVDEINRALFQKCVLTKYLSKDVANDNTLNQLINETNYRALIMIGQKYFDLPIQNAIFIPTSFNTLEFIDKDISTIVCSDIISSNISNTNHTIGKTLIYIQNYLYEQLFTSSVDNNKSLCFEINQLINLINNYYENSFSLDINNIIVKYFKIIDKINVFLLKNNKNIVKISINDYFLQDFIFIQQIYFYIFVLIKNNSTQIFDVYKSAKKYEIFSKKYFNYIDYFYTLCSDQNLQYCVYNYCQSFSHALLLSLRAMSTLETNNFIQGMDTKPHFNLAQKLLQIDINTNNKSLLGYAKLLNII